MLINRADWDKNFAGYYQGKVLFGASMKEHTSLSIGGAADVIVTPEDPVSLKNIVTLLGRQKLPYCTVGGGSNILVSDSGIEGVVIRVKAFDRVEVIDDAGDSVLLFVEAGVALPKLVNFCRDKGYAGMEGLVGIPGTVGGAVCGNAGSYGAEMKDLIVSVVLLNADGVLERFSSEDLNFGYRSSAIGPDDIVLSANLKLNKDEAEAVAGRTAGFLNEKKRSQPIGERSAGCVFRNAEGMPAGRLIDEAGCKGMRVGDIEVSRLHANFFVNCGEGSASDYRSLMHEVSEKVRNRFGLELEPEIRVIGNV